VALPAILPILAVLLSWPRRTRDLELLALANVAFVLTVFPRADVAHLAFVAALPYVLCAAGIARWLPARPAAGIAMAGILLAAIFGSNFFSSFANTVPVASAVGRLRVASNDAANVERLVNTVRPGSGLFVYPYMPIQYFATQAQDPTRFSFLAPGMMTQREASIALDELQARPPQWLLYMKLSQTEFLRVFPHAADLDWHFGTLETWLEANYEPASPDITIWGYRLYCLGGRTPWSASRSPDRPARTAD
jgi:hypothetical protein